MLISNQFFIPNATQKVKQFIQSCNVCSKKPGRRPTNIPVRQTSAKHPWSCVHMDLMGPMPKSDNGNKYILVMVCNLTRWTAIRCIPTKHAQCVADACFDIFCERGPPLSILCDNGREFKNKGLELMLKNLGVHIQYSTPRQPETNGIVERTNQKVKQQLQNWGGSSSNWEDLIPPIQLTINLEHNRMMNCSPWMAIHGWALQRMEYLDSNVLENMSIDEFSKKQWAKWHSVRMTKFLENIYKRDVQLKLDRYERLKKKNGEETSNDESRNTLIRIGSEVLIEFPQPVGETGKLYNPWKGLFIVVKQLDKNTYLVGHAENSRRHFQVHRKRMRVVNNSNKAVMSRDAELGKSSDQMNQQPVQCESPATTADAADDAEDVKATRRGGKSRDDLPSSAPKSRRELKKRIQPTHKMTTRSKRLDL